MKESINIANILINILINLAIIIAVLLVLAWIFRSIICWYFEISARLKEAEKTNQLLKDIYDLTLQNAKINAITAGEVLRQGGGVLEDKNILRVKSGTSKKHKSRRKPDTEDDLDFEDDEPTPRRKPNSTKLRRKQDDDDIPEL